MISVFEFEHAQTHFDAYGIRLNNTKTESPLVGDSATLMPILEFL